MTDWFSMVNSSSGMRVCLICTRMRINNSGDMFHRTTTSHLFGQGALQYLLDIEIKLSTMF